MICANPLHHDPLAGDRAILFDGVQVCRREVVVLSRIGRHVLIDDDGRRIWTNSAFVELSAREEELRRQDQRRAAMNAPLSLAVDPS